MAQTFQASRISGNGNAIFPDKLIVDDNKVTYYKAHLIGHEETNIMRSNIGSVSLKSGVLFADIIIETNGGQITVINGFNKSDAKQIVRLLS
ncbi:MAG: PH domain-containing protein [Paludibacteraceae bacterium]|nr:PH domain-containing protein [Paludibacteraceae bacterium]